MSVIRLHYSGGCVHLAVVRFMIGGSLAVVNMLASRKLQEHLSRLCVPSGQLSI